MSLTHHIMGPARNPLRTHITHAHRIMGPARNPLRTHIAHAHHIMGSARNPLRTHIAHAHHIMGPARNPLRTHIAHAHHIMGQRETHWGHTSLTHTVSWGHVRNPLRTPDSLYTQVHSFIPILYADNTLSLLLNIPSLCHSRKSINLRIWLSNTSLPMA